MREEGYYWVHLRLAGIVRMAEWSDGAWWLIGDATPFGDSSKIQPIGERLEPPQLETVGMEMEKSE